MTDLAVAGALAYVVILLADPVLDSGRNVLTTHPEDYANGAYGFLVNVSYAVFAAALALIAIAFLMRLGWRGAAALLLLPPAILCAALATAPPAVARSGAWVSVAILGLAAGPPAASLTAAAAFGRLRNPCMSLAVLTLMSFVALVAAPEAISGLVNRIFDVVAGCWVVLASLALRASR